MTTVLHIQPCIVQAGVDIDRFMNYTMLFPNWQKESWQTFEETSGYVRPERVNKWPNSITDI